MSSELIFIYNEDIAIHRDGIISAGINPKTLEKSAKRNNAKRLERSYYSFDSLGSWQLQVLEYLGYESKDKLMHDLLVQRQKEAQNTHLISVKQLPDLWAKFYDTKDELWFRSKLTNRKTIKDLGQKCIDMATVLSIFRFIDSFPTKSVILEATGFDGKVKLVEAIAYRMKGDAELNMAPMPIYSLAPNQEKILKKYYKWRKCTHRDEERETIMPGYINNKNAQVADGLHLQVIKEVLLDPSKPDKQYAWSLYSKIMQREYAQEFIKESRFYQISNTREMKALSALMREGEFYFETHIAPFHTRGNCKYSLSLVAGDGWMPGRSIKGIGGMNVWYWIDWHSKAILSWRISKAESSEEIRLSLRDMINLIGYVPLSLMMDKKWEKNPELKELMRKLNIKGQPKAAYRPNQTIIERQNKERNKVHRRLDEHWVNMTPGVSRDNHHNPEHLRGAKPMEYADFADMIMKMFNSYNHTALDSLNGKTPYQQLQENINPACQQLDPLVRTWAFGAHKYVTVNNYKFQIEIASKKYEYIIPTEQIKRFTKLDIKNNKVKVYYDEEFMDTVDIYAFTKKDEEINDTFICTCESINTVKYNPVVVEWQDEDEHKFHKSQQRKNTMKEYMGELLDEKEEVLNDYKFDRASVHIIKQEEYKEAMSNDIAKMYANYYGDQERDRGRKQKPVKTDKPSKAADKYNLLKNLMDEFE